MNRRKSREAAMKLIYEMSINKNNVEDILNNFKENTDADLTNIDMEYIRRVIEGIQEHLDAIDKKIDNNLINWKLNRLSKIDLAILRMSTYELMFEDDIPSAVSVNEGIELAKKYSQDNTGAFINGVLGNMIKQQE